MRKAIVIFSGGQDSTTCLGWAKNRFDETLAVSFFYGQRHEIELQQAKTIARILAVPLQVIDISFYGSMVRSALTGAGDLNASHEDHGELPASFVPNRNALFVLLAHSLAQTLKVDTLITGVCQTDYSGYPDCRREFIDAIQHSLNLGSSSSIAVLTPLMQLTKAQTFKLAETEGVLDLVLKESHTCYNGSAVPNKWGRGCGSCPACRLRAKGFEEYKTQFGVH
jgi:7-cyano-7-deazaguanine synthase